MLVMGDITVAGDSWAQLAFKNCWPFITCITKVDGTTIDDAEDLDLVMPMYNLWEYNSNYSTRQAVYGFIPKIKQIILMLILITLMFLNLLRIRLNYCGTQLLNSDQITTLKFKKIQQLAYH